MNIRRALIAGMFAVLVMLPKAQAAEQNKEEDNELDVLVNRLLHDEETAKKVCPKEVKATADYLKLKNARWTGEWEDLPDSGKAYCYAVHDK